ncbi:MAG: tetratricopeptide repeat protein [Candidatus Brocadiia bacterium]
MRKWHLLPAVMAFLMLAFVGCAKSDNGNSADEGASRDAVKSEAAAHYQSGLDKQAQGDADGALLEYRAAFALIDGNEPAETIKADFPFVYDAGMRLAEILCPFEKSRWGKKCYQQPGWSFPYEKYVEASNALLIADKVNPVEGKAYLMIGKLSLAYGDYNSAYFFLRKHSERDPGDSWCRLYMADIECINAMQGKPEDRERWQRFANSRFIEVIDAMPNEPAAYYSRALFFEYLGNTKEALNDLDQALKIDPNFFAAKLDKALALNAEGLTDESVRLLNECVQLDPTASEPHYRLAYMYYSKASKSGYASANGEIDKAIALDSNNSDYWSLKGQILDDSTGRDIIGSVFQAGKMPEGAPPKVNAITTAAIEAYTKAIALHPDEPNLYYRRGIAYIKLVDKVNAKSDLQRAIELGRPDDPNTFRYAMSIAFIFFAEENHKENIRYCEIMFESYVYARKLIAVANHKIRTLDSPLPTTQAQIDQDFGCMVMFWGQSCDKLKDPELTARRNKLLELVAISAK